MIIYVPRLIESAEQAEALPIGTVAFAYGPLRGACYTKDAPDNWEGAHLGWDDRDADMIGWTALVPIEAEEEFTAMGTDHGEHWIAHVGRDGIDGSRKEAELYVERFGGFIARRNRTPWEEA